MLKGRRIIYTDVDKITYKNIIDVLQNTITTHEANSMDCSFLIEYEKGNQPLAREKKVRTDIDIQVVDNLSSEIASFWTSYSWGNPITLVSRGLNDSGVPKESEAITLLNEFLSSVGWRKKTQELARYVEICGIGYTLVDIKKNYQDGDCPFTLDILNPYFTYVVYSSRYHDRRPMMAVTYRRDSDGNRYFTCFTEDSRFEVVNMKVVNGEVLEEETWSNEKRSGESNPLGMINITEWFRNHDRTGCFERQIPQMDALNIVKSDICNATDETVQSIWHTNDVDFPKDEKTGETIHPKSNDWLQTYTTQDGKQPFVTPLHSNFDYQGNLNYANTLRTTILQNAFVPCRNDNSGGSTGIAMSDATGWSQAEVVATKKQAIMEDCMNEVVKIVLKACKEAPNFPEDNPIQELLAKDVVPSIKRQKTYEMNTKINAFATGVSHGIDYKSMLKVINLFDDPNQVAVDSAETMEMYINSVFKQDVSDEDIDDTEDRLMQDESDQIENSPKLDKNRS